MGASFCSEKQKRNRLTVKQTISRTGSRCMHTRDPGKNCPSEHLRWIKTATFGRALFLVQAPAFVEHLCPHQDKKYLRSLRTSLLLCQLAQRRGTSWTVVRSTNDRSESLQQYSNHRVIDAKSNVFRDHWCPHEPCPYVKRFGDSRFFAPIIPVKLPVMMFKKCNFLWHYHDPGIDCCR